MICYKDKILEDFFIDPITTVITNDKGEVQNTFIKDGYAYFKGMAIHKIQVHTHLGYKKGFDIHHIDKNKLNNSLSNLVYLTHSEHTTLHMKGKHNSEETKKKMSEAKKENNCRLGTKHSEATKLKISDSSKDRIWINNGMINKFVKIDEEIPEGFVCGMLKRKK